MKIWRVEFLPHEDSQLGDKENVSVWVHAKEVKQSGSESIMADGVHISTCIGELECDVGQIEVLGDAEDA